MNLGNILKEGRKSKRIKQRELADIMEVSLSTISHWEQNIRSPSVADFIKLIKILDLVAKVFPEYVKKEEVKAEVIDLEQIKNALEQLKTQVEINAKKISQLETNQQTQS